MIYLWSSINTETYGLCYAQSGNFWWRPVWLCRWSLTRVTPYPRSTLASYCAALSSFPYFCFDVSWGGHYCPVGKQYIQLYFKKENGCVCMYVCIHLWFTYTTWSYGDSFTIFGHARNNYNHSSRSFHAQNICFLKSQYNIKLILWNITDIVSLISASTKTTAVL